MPPTNPYNFDMPRLWQSLRFSRQPEPFERGEPEFWTDPHIASQMLLAHLDPHLDAASRRPKVIDETVQWISSLSAVKAGANILDLGCGPGLYAERLARAGFSVTGVDFSRNSIDYAKKSSIEQDLNIRYLHQNYLNLDIREKFDLVLLIYGDYCPLNPEERKLLLQNIYSVLKDDGLFIFDVSTPAIHRGQSEKNRWYFSESGFWKANPHLVLEQGFSYPGDIYLDQYIILEENGKTSVYRNWFQDFTSETISKELSENNFKVIEQFNDLAGTELTSGHSQCNSDWIGMIAKKQAQST